MRKLRLIVVTAVVSTTLAWLLFVMLYKPRDHQYLIATTSHYFKSMSEEGLTEVALYSDCRLDDPDDSDKRQGVAMFGHCRAENDTFKYYYMLAMNSMTGIVYFDLEVRPK